MTDESPTNLKPCCRHIRHKLKYCDARHDAPNLVDDSSDTRVFFCIKTFDALGPDNEPVSPDDCAGARECFCA